MPSSYQAAHRGDTARRQTFSQTAQSNISDTVATVGDLLLSKGQDIFSISPDGTLHEAVEALRDKRIGALVVADDEGGLKGILSERDIVRKLAQTPGQTLPQRVADVMTHNVETCTPDDPLVSVLKRMTEGRFRHMPVLDDAKLMGMVTIGDVVNFRLVQLEHEALQLKQLIVG